MQVEELFTKVLAYQEKLGYNYTYPNLEKRMEHLRHLVLAQIVEVTETLDWMPWKPWRKAKDQELNQREAALEVVDQMFFLVNQWHCIGYKDESFEELFEHKLMENLDRINRKYNCIMPDAEGGEKL